MILTVMFSNKSEKFCDYFHKFKQNISFCITDIQVPVFIKTKPKLYFQYFPKFQDANCLVKENLLTSTYNHFLYSNFYNIIFTLYNI